MGLFTKNIPPKPSKSAVQISTYAKIWNNLNLVYNYYVGEFSWDTNNPDQAFVDELSNIHALVDWSLLQLLDEKGNLNDIKRLALPAETSAGLKNIHSVSSNHFSLDPSKIDLVEEQQLEQLLVGFHQRVENEAGFRAPMLQPGTVQRATQIASTHGTNTIMCYLCATEKPWSANIVCKRNSPHSWGEENRDGNWISSVEQNDYFSTIMALTFKDVSVNFIAAWGTKKWPSTNDLTIEFDVIAFICHVYKKAYRK
jgi:hypothetical protein